MKAQKNTKRSFHKAGVSPRMERLIIDIMFNVYFQFDVLRMQGKRVK